MNKIYSEQIKKILSDAKSIALERNERPNSIHLLYAMFQTEDTICRFIFLEKQINTTKFKEKWENFLEKEEQENIYQKIIDKSKEIAIRYQSKHVYDEHLLYAILLEPESFAYQLVVEFNFIISKLLDEIEEIFDFDLYEEEVLPYLINLSKITKPHRYIKRGDYIERLKYILKKKQKNNPLLIGSAGVGKTAIVEGLAEIYEDATIYQLNLATTIADTKYRGELEEKLVKVMDYIKSTEAIIFIDEIHNIVGAGSNDGSLDIANLLKPYLARSDIKCIGATTLDEYYRYIAKDKALMRRFQTILVDEPSIKETKQIIEGIIDQYEEYHNITYPEEIIGEIIKIADCYLPNKTFPDKAIDLMDELASRYNLIKKNNNHKIKIMHSLLKQIVFEESGIKPITISKLNKVNLNYKEYLPIYEKFLKLEKPNNNLLVIDTNKSFKIAYLLDDLKYIFNLKDEMYLEINLESYQDYQTLSNLIGSSKGYVGYDQGGLLTNHLLKYPFSVIYFKNFDKANYQIQTYLKSILKTNHIFDSKNNRIVLQNVIFIFDQEQKKDRIGFNIKKEAVI